MREQFIIIIFQLFAIQLSSAARFVARSLAQLTNDLLSAINMPTYFIFRATEKVRKKTQREIRNEFVDDGIQSMSATPDSFVC